MHCNIACAPSLNKHKSNNNNLTLCYYYSHNSHVIPYFSWKVLLTLYTKVYLNAVIAIHSIYNIVFDILETVIFFLFLFFFPLFDLDQYRIYRTYYLIEQYHNAYAYNNLLKKYVKLR